MATRKTSKLEPVGKKIKKVRLEKNLTLERVANDTGFAVDYLKDLEAGNIIPPVGTLLSLSRALGLDSGFLLQEQEAVLKDRVEAYTKRTENYAYKTLTPGAENKHLKAFQVTIDPMAEHHGVGYLHEGEEFIYVLRGCIEVIVGENVNLLNTSDSLHFNSGIRHQLRNVGSEEAELLVVVYGP
jgi:quercetin dioxygenase-like cupin family protein